jgi:ribonuclease BN (tRNA processing enzyme)
VIPYRSQPANLVVVRGTPYLFDAGNGVLRQLALADVPFQQIKTIFLTHLHDDHTADVGTIFGMQWDFAGGGHALDVYGPPGTSRLVRGFHQFFARNAELRISDAASSGNRTNKLYPAPKTLFRGHDLPGDGLVYQDDNIRVYAAENSHYHFPPGTPAYKRDKSYSYRVETPDRVVVFTGDTGPSAATTRLASGADILVSEVISVERIMALMPPEVAQFVKYHMENEHLTPEGVGKMAAAAEVKMVVLSHVAPGAPTDPDAAYLDGVTQHYKGRVVLAHDLQEF